MLSIYVSSLAGSPAGSGSKCGTTRSADVRALAGSYSATVAMPVGARTDRLSLRLLGPGDFEAVHSLFASSGHTIGDGPITDPAWTVDWLARRQRRHREDGLAWYGLWESSGEFVGTCGAFIGRCGDEPEIGYEIDVAWRRRGYASEAASFVTGAAHAAGHAHVWATIRPSNTASVRVVQGIGYRLDHIDSHNRGRLDYYVSEAE